MTLREAADRLGLDPSTLRHALRSGALRGRKVGRDWQVTAQAVERYQAEHKGRVGRPPKKEGAGR